MFRPINERDPGDTPYWADDFPDRFQFEIKEIQKRVGNSLKFNADLLQRRVLELAFDWERPTGEVLSLQATFPDSYPYLRPQVRLVAHHSELPQRHASPVDGTLCLLGRDTGLWPPQMTLRKLLEKQLEKTLSESSDEDPQGEPVEYWWNIQSDTDSYILIDSSWNIQQATAGYYRLRFTTTKDGSQFILRGAVDEIYDEEGRVLATRSFPLPTSIAVNTKEARFRWTRVDRLNPPTNEQLQDETFRNEFFLRSLMREIEPQRFDTSKHFSIHAAVQQTELGHQQSGDTWLFPMFLGTAKNLKHRKAKFQLVRTLRAGSSDLGARVPATDLLKDRKIAIIGLGSLGAPLAIELAKARCEHLIVLDYDRVEPGNSVRWPIGASSWGMKKTTAIEDHVRTEYPWCEVTSHDIYIGCPEGLSGQNPESAVLTEVFRDADLVLDAVASTGVSRVLCHYAQKAGKILLSLYGTQTLEGGVVAVYRPKSGCPNCREYAYESGMLGRPPGSGDETTLVQPAGCSERTFTGANYDLQEITNEAVRLLIETLRSPNLGSESTIATLSLFDENGQPLPKWRIDDLPPMKECGCNP